MMASYAEVLNIIKHANAGLTTRTADTETTPLPHPERYRYDIDIAHVAEVWWRGSRFVGGGLKPPQAASVKIHSGEGYD